MCVSAARTMDALLTNHYFGHDASEGFMGREGKGMFHVSITFIEPESMVRVQRVGRGEGGEGVGGRE